MRIETSAFIVVVAVTTVPGVAYAQRPAIGVSIGQTVTSSLYLNNGPGVAGDVEGPISPRVSLRGQVGVATRDITGLSYAGTLKPLYFLGNVVYDWDNGKWRPYVTAGGGMYRYSFEEAGVTGSHTNAGIDVGGGAAYLFTRDAAVTFETLYHRMGNVPTNRATLGFKGSFWSINVGAKKYF